MLDVGGDVLAHGDEPGLASPLCDAIVLAAGLILARSSERGEVIGAVYGPGCDGELTPDEVLERITALQSAGALLGAWGLTPRPASSSSRAAEVVPTEASLQAVRCARGERGTVSDPRRQAERWSSPRSAGSPSSSIPRRAASSAVPLATAVSPAAEPRGGPRGARGAGREHGAGARARPSPRVAWKPAPGPPMTWIETDSLSFTARHDDADLACAHRVLDSLEDLRLRLEDRFDQVPGNVTVILHDNPAWLSAAHPLLPAVRWSAAPAARRYLAGWPMAGEIHTLNDSLDGARSAGEDSLRALRGTAERMYCQIVLAANNPALPPMWTPRRFLTYLRWAWLIEGAAQYFTGQTALYRAAVITRLREGERPAFPPTRRDALILGGTVFDLLDRHAGPEACVRMATRLHRDGPAREPRARLRGAHARHRARLADAPRRDPLPAVRVASRRPR